MARQRYTRTQTRKNPDGTRETITRTYSSYGEYLIVEGFANLFAFIFMAFVRIVTIPFYFPYWLIRFIIKPLRIKFNVWAALSLLFYALLLYEYITIGTLSF